jgi:hypothetical protein
MAAAFGWNEQNWVGQQIIVYRGTAQYQGRIVPAVAIEPVVPNRIGAQAPKPRLAAVNAMREPPPFDDDGRDYEAEAREMASRGEPDPNDTVPF